MIAGNNLAGSGMQFGGLPPSHTLKVLGLDLFSIGQFMPQDASFRVMEQEADGRYFRFVFHEDRLVGAILLGDLQLMSVTRKVIEEKQDCSKLLRRAPTAELVIAYFGTGGRSKPEARATSPMSESPGSSATGEEAMATYRCEVCGYVYDEREEGSKWSDLPDDWVCPVCGVPKSSFELVQEGDR